MKKIMTFLCLFTWPVWAETTVYFTPGNDCENQIIQLLDRAEKEVVIDIYALTNKKIGQAIERVADRGIPMRILSDRQQAGNRYSLVVPLHQRGIDIRVNSRHRIEHNKYAVIDGKYAVTGSYNWTSAASLHNSENCLILWNEPDTIQKYQKRFNALWEMNSPQKSELWFRQKEIK